MQLISTKLKDVDSKTIAAALDYCCKNKLYSATDFADALAYFIAQDTTVTKVAVEEEKQESDIRMLDKKDIFSLKIKPQIRDVKVYQQIANGEMPCNN